MQTRSNLSSLNYYFTLNFVAMVPSLALAGSWPLENVIISSLHNVFVICQLHSTWQYNSTPTQHDPDPLIFLSHILSLSLCWISF